MSHTDEVTDLMADNARLRELNAVNSLIKRARSMVAGTVDIDLYRQLADALAQAKAREAEWKAEKAQAHDVLRLEPDECDLITACRLAMESMLEARAEAAAMREQRDRLQEELDDCWQIVADLKEAGFCPEKRTDADAMREALEIIAGNRQCVDNLMSNQDVARAALRSGRPQGEETGR